MLPISRALANSIMDLSSPERGLQGAVLQDSAYAQAESLVSGRRGD